MNNLKNLVLIYAALFINCAAPKNNPLTIHDVSNVQIGTIDALMAPSNYEELRTCIGTSKGPLSIAGGRFSQGGHIWYTNGTVIDMRNFNRVKELDVVNKTITVEAGMTWRQLQQFIQQCGLSIKVMQSYNDFSIGGSVAVNVHGRDIAYGPLIETILSVNVMLADGSIITTSRQEQSDLFALVCGGYGAGGVITEVTLSLTDNVNIECVTTQMNIANYKKFFFAEIYKNPDVVLHNANLYPNEYQDVVAVTWKKTSQPLTIQEPLQKPKKIYIKEGIASTLLRYIPWLKQWRLPVEQKSGMISPEKHVVVGRNYEMSSTVLSLEPLNRSITTPILQEYFIPFEGLEAFVNRCAQQRNNTPLMCSTFLFVMSLKIMIPCFRMQKRMLCTRCIP